MIRVGRHLAWILCFQADSLIAQSPARPNEKTTAPADSRFEIIQPAFSAKYTFRIDKFTGETSQLLVQPDRSATWQSVAKSAHPLADTKSPGRTNYQVFSSGIAVRYTYLINVHTGATWQLMEGSPEGPFWSAIHSRAPK